MSIVSRCDECNCYHMECCLNAGATIDEIMEARNSRIKWNSRVKVRNSRVNQQNS
ncbi:carboxymuconolactone decarboxylase family protein [Peribacillus sp. NPDC096622]|uniref:carboxymuconolactone decarboxylase family protein n=1 Tax=Peribacillus sp. NPDC096622 TaxID=3364396 RepID=UPI003815F8F9